MLCLSLRDLLDNERRLPTKHEVTMASLAARDMAAAMRAAFTMLSTGQKLEARAATREAVVKQMQVLCAHMQVPLGDLSVVHIAGTKGKGSTASMCESMLRGSGYSTGACTSYSFAFSAQHDLCDLSCRPVHIPTPCQYEGTLSFERKTNHRGRIFETLLACLGHSDSCCCKYAEMFATSATQNLASKHS